MKYKYINLEYLNEMSGGDRKMMLEMIDIYNAEVPGYLERMKTYLDSDDHEALGKLAHKAKASASIMGLKNLAEDLKQLEHLAKEGKDPDLYSDYVEKITVQFTLSIEELRQVARTI